MIDLINASIGGLFMKAQLSLYREKYFTHHYDRTMTMTVCSFLLNFSIGIAKIGLGAVYTSLWLILLGSYSIILSLSRLYIIWVSKKLVRITDRQIRTQHCKEVIHRSGTFMIVLGISYFIVCLCLYFFDEKTTYPDYLLYGVAAAAFYKIGSAVYGLISARIQQSLLLSVLKVISFLDACVSIVAVQCALLTMKESAVASSSSAFLGMAVSALFLVTGIRMICQKGNINKTGV